MFFWKFVIAFFGCKNPIRIKCRNLNFFKETLASTVQYLEKNVSYTSAVLEIWLSLKCFKNRPWVMYCTCTNIFNHNQIQLRDGLQWINGRLFKLGFLSFTICMFKGANLGKKVEKYIESVSPNYLSHFKWTICNLWLYKSHISILIGWKS